MSSAIPMEDNDRTNFRVEEDERAPRAVTVIKTEHGFGFNIRGQLAQGGQLKPIGGQLYAPMQYISAIMKDGPAEKAGLHVGDRIIEVNGQLVEGADHQTVVKLIRQSRNQVKMTVISVSEEEAHRLDLKAEPETHRLDLKAEPETHRLEPPNPAADSNAQLYSTLDQKYLHNALKEGEFVTSSITKAVLQGPAGAGKTSMKCMLLAKPYTELSTSCIEDPQIVGKFALNESGEQWKSVDGEDMTVIVLAELHSRAKKLLEFEFKEKPILSSSIDSVKTSSDHKAPRQITYDSNVVQPNKDEVEHEVVSVVNEFFDIASNSIKAQELNLNQKWLHFIDSGGQIQFQKLLQAFLPCASVLLLVFSLADDFSSPSSTVMRYHEDVQVSVSTSDDMITVEELLTQLITMINSTAQKQKEMINSDEFLSKYIIPPDGLSVIAIGTHRDVYDEKVKKGEEVEDIEDKEAKLDAILQSLQSKVIYQGDNIIHEVDGRKAKDPKAEGIFDDEVIQVIGKKLHDQAYKVHIPLKWHCFDVVLHAVARNTPDSCGVFSLSYCQRLGVRLEMSNEEVVSALKFFHILNAVLYYPESSVYDLVFVLPEYSIVKIISELMKKICDVRSEKRVPPRVKAMALEGKITVESLTVDSPTCSSLLKIFYNFDSKLLDLFEHLLIANKIEDDQYFMPALLPVVDPSKRCPPFPGSTPLLYYFKDGLPMGFFCAMIVHLLKNSFELVADKYSPNYSNYLVLSNPKGNIVIIERLYWFEVYSESSSNQIVVIAAIDSAIDATVTVRKLPQGTKPVKAFHCPCDEEIPHAAEYISETNKLRCIVTRKIITNVEDTSDLLQSRPELCDLMHLLAKIAPQYSLIGIALKVPMDSLGLHPQPDYYRDNLSRVLQWWLNNGNNPTVNSPVTWDNIIGVIGGSLIQNYEVARTMKYHLSGKMETKTKWLSALININDSYKMTTV